MQLSTPTDGDLIHRHPDDQLQKQFTVRRDQFEFIKRMRYEEDLPHSETVRRAIDLLMRHYEEHGRSAIYALERAEMADVATE